MLNRMTSACEATARLMSPKSMASLILASKNSTACLLWPSCECVPFRSRYDSTLMKCDLPEPKKPETQMPILPATSGSFGFLIASP